MITLNAPIARGIPRRAQAKSSCKRAIIVGPLLSISLLLIGIPVMKTAEPVFVSNPPASVSHLFNPCGDKPGICPNSPSTHPDRW